MKITLVQQQKKNPRRFNIFLDGKFAFASDEDTIVNNRLIKGKEISSEDLPKLLLETEVGKLMERLYVLFIRRQRSEKEVRDYLKYLSFKRKVKKQEEISKLIMDELVERLKRKGMINDRQFAQSWIIARRKSKKKGINAIKAELIQKGIARQNIDEALVGTLRGESEESLAKQALEKKLRLWKNLGSMEFKKKALEFLLRRGFSYDLAKDVVNAWLRKD